METGDSACTQSTRPWAPPGKSTSASGTWNGSVISQPSVTSTVDSSTGTVVVASGVAASASDREYDPRGPGDHVVEHGSASSGP